MQEPSAGNVRFPAALAFVCAAIAAGLSSFLLGVMMAVCDMLGVLSVRDTKVGTTRAHGTAWLFFALCILYGTSRYGTFIAFIFVQTLQSLKIKRSNLATTIFEATEMAKIMLDLVRLT